MREHVARLDIPPEPPVGSVVISSADGLVRQAIAGRSGRLTYPRRGDIFYDGLTWPQLLSYGSVEVIWRPDAEMPDMSTRAAAFELLAVLDTGGIELTDVEVRDAVALLRRRLVGDQTADASSAPG